MGTDQTESLRNHLLSLRPPIILLPISGHAPVSFRTLSGKDLDGLVTKLDLPPVDFAVEVLAQQAQGLPNASTVLLRLPRPTLLRLVRSWASHSNTFAASALGVRGFADFKHVAEAKVNEWLHPIRELGKQLSTSIGQVLVPPFPKTLADEIVRVEAVSQSISAMAVDAAAITKGIATTLCSNLPDLEEMQRAVDEIMQGKAHLDAHGYGFAVFDAAPGGLRLIAREQPSSRVIHRLFLDESRAPEFTDRLLARVAASRRLKPRNPIIQAILTAHLQRNYALSVPCLYTQLEGILTELLVLEGTARRKGKHTVATGSTKRLVGLRSKAGAYGTKQTSMRTFVTSGILERLTPDRNAVLHGRTTGYRQASRSARLVLLVDAMTRILTKTEMGR